MFFHQFGCEHVALIHYCVKKRIPQVSHLNSFSTVQVFTFTVILKIPVSFHHTIRFVPQRGCTFVSSKFFCVQRCVTTETAALHDSIILSDMCKPPASHLKFLSNISVKTQSLRHHLFVKHFHTHTHTHTHIYIYIYIYIYISLVGKYQGYVIIF